MVAGLIVNPDHDMLDLSTISNPRMVAGLIVNPDHDMLGLPINSNPHSTLVTLVLTWSRG